MASKGINFNFESESESDVSDKEEMDIPPTPSSTPSSSSASSASAISSTAISPDDAHQIAIAKKISWEPYASYQTEHYVFLLWWVNLARALRVVV